ncbi:T9SS type A sorting domain-containing protein [Ferruginibacter sp.]
MKYLFIFFSLLLGAQCIFAQDPAYPPAPAAPGNIVKAEYFFDTDPGFGNGVNISVVAAVDLPNVLATVNTAALSFGTHRIYLRTLSTEGNWSISNFKEFIVDFNPAYPPAPPAPGNIIKAEYFFDTDPGFGNGVDITVSAAVDLPNVLALVNTAALSVGTHRIYLRTLSVEGNWSISNFKEFIVDFNPAYPPAPPAPGNIIKAEYFFDTDPGFGNGTDIPVTAATNLPNVLAAVNTAALSTGTHRIYLRTLNLEGSWSISNAAEFIVDINPAYPPAPPAPGNIIKAEYFFDADPGFGNGINISITAAIDISNVTATVNTASLSNGTHRIYLRTLNAEGGWCITNLGEFVYDADPAYPAAPAAPGNITVAEYFFDTDPGFGNGSPITIIPSVDIANLNFSADVTALPNGNHVFYIRSKDDWSITSIIPFVKGSAVPLLLLSFSGKKINSTVQLNWITENEINTSHFEIERSANAIAFSTTGIAAATNNSGRNDYTFTDLQPLSGINYYRLKQTDKDGRFTYSPVIKIVNDISQLVFSLSPNPVNNFINIIYPGKKETVTISIYDVQGRLIQQQSKKNELPIIVDLKQLEPGMYFIQVTDGERVQKGKFIKQ